MQQTYKQFIDNIVKTRGRNGCHCSPVYCIEIREYFFKQQDTVHKYKISASCLSSCLSGKQKTAGKYPETGEKLHWKKISWEIYYQNTTIKPNK